MALQTNSSEDQELSEINVTPLVDVMLVLLVIFIVTAPLLTQSLRVELPKTVAGAPAEENPHLRDLGIDAQGQVFIDKTLIPLENLETELQNALQKDSELSLQISADQAVAYGKVAKVMAIAQRVGITKLGMVTLEE